MGIQSIGSPTAPNFNAIVIKNVIATTAGSTGASNTPFRVFVPKGKYSVALSMLGSAGYGSTTATGGTAQIGTTPNTTLQAIDANTGRLGAVYSSNNAYGFGSVFHVAKDSFVSAGISSTDGSINNVRYDIMLIPTASPWDVTAAFTPNAVTTTTGSTSSSNMSATSVGAVLLGYNYDTNQPFVVSGSSTTGNQNTNVLYISSPVIWTYNPTTDTWSSKSWTSTVASGHSGYESAGGGIFWMTDRPSGLFIKNGFIHCLTGAGLITRTSDSIRYGWIKADASGAGSTLTWEPGLSNSNFGNSGTGTGNNNKMMYYWDKRNNKVLFVGSYNPNYNGSYGAYPWNSYWSQWDIATNTIEYQQNNGAVDPRIAGSASFNVYDYAMCDSVEGVTIGVGVNGSYNYLARWNRNGSYSGINNFVYYLPLDGNNGGRALSNSTPNGCNFEFIDTRRVIFSTSAAVSRTYMSGSPSLLQDSTSNFMSSARNGISSLGLANDAVQYLIMSDRVFAMHVTFAKMQIGSGDTRFTIPVAVYSAPKTQAVINMITPGIGGVFDGSTNSTYSGLNGGNNTL